MTKPLWDGRVGEECKCGADEGGWHNPGIEDCRFRLPDKPAMTTNHREQAEAHLSIYFGGYCSDWRFRCAPDQGCNVNPNYKRTAHLRSYERG